MSLPSLVLVSQALAVEDGPQRRSLDNALVAIDSVHQDGTLPPILLQRSLFTDRHGQFVRKQDGTAVSIQVSYFTSHPEFTTIHEIGHFLDYYGFGTGTEWASHSGTLLKGWREAVRKSRAVQRLGRLQQSSAATAPVRQPDGIVVEYPIRQRYLQYLLRPEELWARCYSQFIVLKSGDPTLRRQLHSLRIPPDRAFYYPVQWDDADFVPILEEIETAFRQKGWIMP